MNKNNYGTCITYFYNAFYSLFKKKGFYTYKKIIIQNKSKKITLKNTAIELLSLTKTTTALKFLVRVNMPFLVKFAKFKVEISVILSNGQYFII